MVPGIAILSFWTFMTAICMAGFLIPYLRHREAQKTICTLAQRGGTIDAATLEALVRLTRGRDPISPQEFGRRLILPGVLLVALGPGLAILGFFCGLAARVTLYPLYGVGALCLCLGLAIAGYAIWLMRTTSQEGLDPGR